MTDNQQEEMTMTIDNIAVEVEFKPIKNMHLAVYPPDGRVHVSAPERAEKELVHAFVCSKWAWVLAQREAINEQERQTVREYVSGECHYLFGERYRLRVEEVNEVPCVRLQGGWIILSVRPGSTTFKRQEVMRNWMRGLLRERLPLLVDKWAVEMGEEDFSWQVKQMRSKWGSCQEKKRSLLFNLELARVPMRCIEYVVVHEMVHLTVDNHSKAFECLMDKYLPAWRLIRLELNHFVASAM